MAIKPIKPSRATSRFQRAFTLVELMVGLAIGMVLTTGMFILISNTSQAFKVQDDFARMQENATGAFNYLGTSLRMAGFYGHALDGSAINTGLDGIATVNDCGSATATPAANWALDTATPIMGYNGLTSLTVHGVLPCILGADFVAGPILAIRAAGGFRIPDVTAQPDYTTTVYLQSSPGAGILFYGNDFASLKAAGSTFTTPTGADADIFEYKAFVYHIRPCSRPTGGVASCTGPTDDDGHPVPTLVREELIGSTMTEVPLVEGVEQMSFQYGVDSTGDGVADEFMSAPAAGDWANVVAVRASLLVRSPTLIAQYNDAGKTYDLDGDGVVDYDCTTDAVTVNPCNYKRKVYSQVFQARNLAQRKASGH